MLYLLLLPIYIAVNAYFFYEVYGWIEAIMKTANSGHKRRLIFIEKTIFSVLYSFCALALLLAFAIPDKLAQSSDFWWKLRRFLKLVGNYHEGVLLYLLMVFGSVAIYRGIRHLVHKIKKKEDKPVSLRHMIIGLVCFSIIVAVTFLGVIGGRKIHVTNYSVSVDKKVENMDGLRIVLVSDLHMGYNIGVNHIQKMVDMINEADADIVLIAGDIYDNEYLAMEDPERLAQVMGTIKSRYGVYACYGNHDIEEPILGGFTFGSHENKTSSTEMDELLEKAGIVLLKDEYVLVNDSFYIYGRPDYARPGKGIETRKTAEELVAGLDLTKPVIVIDHQPQELQELSAAGVDMDLCGHTHDGQLFPLNYFQKWFLWDNSCGYLQVGNMHNIVTSGVGLFGPNMRVGTKAEICVIEVEFE